MATQSADIPTTRAKPTREEALAIAEGRKAARRARTGRLRRWIVVASIAAFMAPFGIIYTQVASGRDPALAGTQAVASASAAKTTTSTTTTATTPTTTTAPTTTTTTTSQAPAAVTTSQS